MGSKQRKAEGIYCVWTEDLVNQETGLVSAGMDQYLAGLNSVSTTGAILKHGDRIGSVVDFSNEQSRTTTPSHPRRSLET